MTDLSQIFREQGDACLMLGSPFMNRLCGMFADNLDRSTEVGRVCLDWSGDPRPSADSVPLRLCGGLHALVLSGSDDDLAATYPAYGGDGPEWALVKNVLQRHKAFLLEWLKSPPQTNEVGRSGVLWPGFMAISSLVKRPLSLLEVGASAGLNLNLDRFGYTLAGRAAGRKSSTVHLSPEWRGDAPIFHEVEVVDRAACDIRPIDVRRDEDALRLRAYLWPDQHERMARLDAAISILRDSPINIAREDAVAWLEKRLAEPSRGVCMVIYSTIAWQYLSEEARGRGATLIASHGAMADEETPLAWLRLEPDGETPGAGIRLDLWPGDRTFHLGRADFHGRWVDWQGTDEQQTD